MSVYMHAHLIMIFAQNARKKASLTPKEKAIMLAIACALAGKLGWHANTKSGDIQKNAEEM